MNEIMDRSEADLNPELDVSADNSDLTVILDGKRYEAEVTEIVKEDEDR